MPIIDAVTAKEAFEDDVQTTIHTNFCPFYKNIYLVKAYYIPYRTLN